MERRVKKRRKKDEPVFRKDSLVQNNKEKGLKPKMLILMIVYKKSSSFRIKPKDRNFLRLINPKAITIMIIITINHTIVNRPVERIIYIL